MGSVLVRHAAVFGILCLGLPGCVVYSVASTGVSAAASVVGTTVEVASDVVGGTADMVLGGGEEDDDPKPDETLDRVEKPDQRED